MLGKVLKDIFRSNPGIRDVSQSSDPLQEARELNRETRDIARTIELRAREIFSLVNYATGTAKTIDAIRLLDFELERHPRYSDSRRLFRPFGQVCSQNGEDGMINEIFRRIGHGNRFFAEVGVGDGNENNTAFLLSQGWQGAWIDGGDAFRKTIEGRADLSNGCLRYLVSIVARENIAQLFDSLQVPVEFDLLSLDIDQNTYYAWEGLQKFRPRVVIVEYNAAIPPDIDWKVNYHPDRMWDGSQNFGASLKAFEKLGRQFGYSLVGCEFMGVNAFFVRTDLVADRFADPFTAENHYEPARYALSHRRHHRTSILDRTVESDAAR